jgi:hypothetical protein
MPDKRSPAVDQADELAAIPVRTMALGHGLVNGRPTATALFAECPWSCALIEAEAGFAGDRSQRTGRIR